MPIIIDKNISVGTIKTFPVNQAIDGWLICDGAALSRLQYKELFNVIGTTYGIGDGSTTFNIPNFAGKFLRGSGSYDGDRFALSLGNIQFDSLQNLYGSLTYISETWSSYGVATGSFSKTSGYANGGTPANADVSNTGRIDFNPSLVARCTNETRPINMAVIYYIKY